LREEGPQIVHGRVGWRFVRKGSTGGRGALKWKLKKGGGAGVKRKNATPAESIPGK